MRKNRKIGLIAWLLGLALANVLLFSLNQGLTPTFWITFVFVWIAFISVIVVQTMVWKKATSPNEQFLRMPAITISLLRGCWYLAGWLGTTISAKSMVGRKITI